MGGNGPWKPFVCEHCDKRFAMYNKLMTHKKIHQPGTVTSEEASELTDTKTYGCDECGKSYIYFNALQKHVLTCAENRQQCPDCDEFYPTRRELNYHRKMHHQTEEDPQMKTKTKRPHVEEKPQKKLLTRAKAHADSDDSEECGAEFSAKKGLKQHTRRHTGDKPFSCEECGKGFTMKCNLNTHRKIHTGERPFTCKVCGKGFIQKNNMIIHTSKCIGP